MKYSIEVDFPKDYPLLQRPHISIEEVLEEAVNRHFGTSDGIEVKVKKVSKKKESK